MDSVVAIIIAIIGAVGSIFQGWGKHVAKEKNKELTSENQELLKENNDLRIELDETKPRLWTEKVCSVMLDGIREAGKTTFLTKLVNPTLEDMPSSTYARYDTTPIPICWSRKNRQPTVYSLKVYDTAGEDDGSVINTLLKMNQQMGKDDKCVLILFWDITKKNENEAQLSPHRLKGLYNNDLGLERISHIIVFVNKLDVARRSMSEAEIKDKAKETHRYLTANLSKHGQISLYYGSALTGEGIHACYGEMLRHFGLADVLPDLSSNFSKAS